MDCALSLVRLGMERNIPGLHSLCDNLVTLETLVYETGCDVTLSLKELQQMKDSEKLKLLMSNVCAGFCVGLGRGCFCHKMKRYGGRNPVIIEPHELFHMFWKIAE